MISAGMWPRGHMLPWLSTTEAAMTADVSMCGHQLAGDAQHMAVLLPQKECATVSDGWAGQGIPQNPCSPWICNRGIAAMSSWV